MELSWVAAGSVLLVGVGYVSVRQATRFRLVCWIVLCVSLFALATRDLFRPRNTGRVTADTDDKTADRINDRGSADRRTPLLTRLGRRIVGWFG